MSYDQADCDHEWVYHNSHNYYECTKCGLCVDADDVE